MPIASEPILEVKGLRFGTPQGLPLATDINFKLESGTVLVITGPNGCGKSTLLQILGGTRAAEAGDILCSVPEESIAVIPQRSSLEFHLPLTLGDLIQISLLAPPPVETITAFGLLEPSHLEISWNTASGGERQRALLTRALLSAPQLLMLDEPFNHLDKASEARLQRAIEGFVADGTTAPRAAILVSHDALEGWQDRDNVQLLDLSHFAPQGSR